MTRVKSLSVYMLTLYLLVSSANNFANSSDPNQAQQNVGPDLDPKCLTLMVFLKDFFSKNLILKKKSAED